MKQIILITLLLLIIGCRHSNKLKDIKNDSTQSTKSFKEYRKIQYSDAQLESFLDSVGNLATKPLADKAAFYADSVFKSQKQMDTVISAKDFDILKHAALKGVMSVKTARIILGNNKIDTTCNEKDVMLTYNPGLIPIVYFPFSSGKNTFDEFALCIGEPGHCENAFLYFFKGSRIIAKHEGYNRYGLDLEHYRDVDGKTVVYYTHEFSDGSGTWWNNFFFFKYENNKLIPILNELQNGNVQGTTTGRFLWLESFVHKTTPLTIKMVYYNDFNSDDNDSLHRIVDDSTIVSYKWDEKSKTLQGQFAQSKISYAQVLSYNTENNDLLFINVYKKTLKNALQMKTRREGVLKYLNEVKNENLQ